MKRHIGLVAALILAALSVSVSGAVARGGHAPIGYQVLCITQPNIPECKGGGASSVRANSDVMATLIRVNDSVNTRIKPQYDPTGADVWSVNASTGDCEEYALAKRRALIQAGLPPSSLRLAYVKTRSGVGHAVLIVKTSRGDMVLDVLTRKIKPLSQSGLRLISMSSSNPTKWI